MRAILFFIATAASGAIISLAIYFLLELLTENAFSMLQPFLPIPGLGTQNLAWLLIIIFATVYIVLMYFASRLLPEKALSGALLSCHVFVYVLYCALVMGGVFLSLPDSLFRGQRFMEVAVRLLVMPDTTLIFMLLPVPAVMANFKKRQLPFISIKPEVVRLALAMLLWIGIVLGAIKLGTAN